MIATHNITHVFVIYDSVAKVYEQPWFSPNEGTAQREFASAVRKPDSRFNRHPADYTLFCRGTFNFETADFELLETPKSLGLAIHYLEEDN